MSHVFLFSLSLTYSAFNKPYSVDFLHAWKPGQMRTPNKSMLDFIKARIALEADDAFLLIGEENNCMHAFVICKNHRFTHVLNVYLSTDSCPISALKNMRQWYKMTYPSISLVAGKDLSDCERLNWIFSR